MVTLCIFAGVILLSVLFTARAVSLLASAVGSPRGRFTVGLAAVFLIFLTNIAIASLAAIIPAQLGMPPQFLPVILLLGQLCVVFIVLSLMFKLSFGRTFVPLIGYIAVSVAMVGFAMMVMRPYLLEAFVFPTHSMMPTIDPGDRFLVNKIIQPRRWDLVAYRTLENGNPVVYCKRLIGLPGERLRFDQGGIFINDQAVTVPAVLAGRCQASIPHFSQARYHDGDTITLGGDEYFFIGDNIDISADSRIYGPTSRSALVGVVDLMYWPLSKIRVIR